METLDMIFDLLVIVVVFCLSGLLSKLTARVKALEDFVEEVENAQK